MSENFKLFGHSEKPNLRQNYPSKLSSEDGILIFRLVFGFSILFKNENKTIYPIKNFINQNINKEKLKKQHKTKKSSLTSKQMYKQYIETYTKIVGNI